MIKLDYSITGNCITKLKISGHANFAAYGEDIVCAGVSSLAVTIANEIINLDNSIEAKDNNGLLSITNITDDEKVQLLCNTLVNGIKLIAEQYPKNIKILVRNN